MQILCQQDVLESSASLCYISATQNFIDFDLSKQENHRYLMTAENWGFSFLKTHAGIECINFLISRIEYIYIYI